MLNLDILQKHGLLSDLDGHFAHFTARTAATREPALLLGAALMSQWLQRGHACLDLRALAGKPLPVDDAPTEACPPFAEWSAALRGVSAVGKPGEYKPLILDEQGRLYLYRYWAYEQNLARHFKARMGLPSLPVKRAALEALTALFPNESKETDWQKLAALTALLRPFCVISGGPGTGKTTTVSKILALLSAQADPPPRIVLAAPTGKAAARLRESISQAKAALNCAEETKALIPEQAVTLHRLLGWREHSPYFRHHRDNPLALDVLVVDEVSMVDLALMSKLLEAVPERARLILLGDHEQLASVEAGAVLGELCEGAEAGFSEDFAARLHDLGGTHAPRAAKAPSRDGIVFLQKSYRFHADSGIGALAGALKQGNTDSALKLLRARSIAAHTGSPESNGAYPDLTWFPHTALEGLRDSIVENFRAYLEFSEPAQKLAAFNQFRILCAHRNGPCSTSTGNRLVEQWLENAGLIQANARWYHGRPIMITENNYHLGLFNGDTGILVYDSERRGLRAMFNGEEGLRGLAPAQLPAHETVYTMTVHKSQGSEFDKVLLWLPEQPSALLGRELLYTGVTRAKKQLTLAGPEHVIQNALNRRIQRASGLRDKLWGN